MEPEPPLASALTSDAGFIAEASLEPAMSTLRSEETATMTAVAAGITGGALYFPPSETDSQLQLLQPEAAPDAPYNTSTIHASSTADPALPPPSPLVQFFTSGARDFRGRSLDDILRYSDSELESHHDYIQVLFPLHEPSAFNDNAPLVTRADAEALQKSPAARASMQRALERMCRFYELQPPQVRTAQVMESDGDDGSRSGTSAFPLLTAAVAAAGSTVKAAFLETTPWWCVPFDHNHLRITRIIRSLRLFGLEEEACALHAQLVRRVTGTPVSKRTRVYWHRAATDGLFSTLR